MPTIDRALSFGVVLAALGMGTACEGDLCDRAEATDQELVLGLWADRFVEIDNGHFLTAYGDRKGGQHVWVSLQAEGLDPGNRRLLAEDTDVPTTLFELIHISSERLAGELHAPSWVAWSGDEDLAEFEGSQLPFSWRGETAVGSIETSNQFYNEYYYNYYNSYYETESTTSADATTGYRPYGTGYDEDDTYLLTATVTDACGTKLTAERRVEIRP